MQTAAIERPDGSTFLRVPAAATELLPGVCWGEIAAFPTPAYWAYQVAAARCTRPASYKLGATLMEEVAACLLGGHGIPASIGLAAFERLRAEGLLRTVPAEERVIEFLQQPLTVHGRSVRYRFAAQKAKYLAASLAQLSDGVPAFSTGRQLRDWLLRLPGVGYKTASWIARNWLDADDVAILDIHILRVGHSIGLFPSRMTVTRDYLELEARFIAMAQAMRIPTSELDAVIWYEMASSPRTVQALLSRSHSRLSQASESHSHAPEPVLAV